MIPSLQEIIQEGLLTLRQPAEGGKRMLQRNIPDAAVWPFFALSVVLGALGAEFNSLINPPAPGTPAVYIAPLLMAVAIGVTNGVMAWMLASIGRGFGGKGSVKAALILISWQQTIWFGVLMVISLVGLIAPNLSTILFLALGIWLLWIFICFTKVLHDFNDYGATVIVFILSMILAGIAMVILIGTFAVYQVTGT